MGRRRKSLKLVRRTESGAVPGTLTSAHHAVPTKIRVTAYSESELIEVPDGSLDDIKRLHSAHPVIWIDVAGLADLDTLRAVGDHFGLHRLALEDVVNVHQRPKCEGYGNHLFLIARMVIDSAPIDTEQICMFLGKGYLITFQEFPGDCLDPIRKRIRDAKGRVRRAGPDYLCYTLIDGIIDGYFPVLEVTGDKLEEVEDRIVGKPEPRHVQELHDLKRDLLVLRRAIWPHREMINSLIRDEHTLFSDTTRVYLRDGYDHTVQLMDIVETYREIASGLVDVYISSMSAKLNEIMKVLAIIGTIFMPLSFIASYYGMNFDTRLSAWNMPELGWKFGNFFALFLMVCTVGCMLCFFWRKRWIDFSWGRRKR